MPGETFDIEIMKVGRWNGIPISLRDLQQMAANHGVLKAAENHLPPIKTGHNDKQEKEIMRDGQPALGWIDKLFVVGNVLKGTISDMPEIVKEAIRAKKYRAVSAEIWRKVQHGGKHIGTVLKAVAILGADLPAVTGLESLDDALKALNASRGGLTFSFEGAEVAMFTQDVEDGKIKNKEIAMDQETLDKALKAQEERFDKRFVSLEKDKSSETERADAAEKLAKEATGNLEKFDKEATATARKEATDKVLVFCEAQVKGGKMMPAHRDKVKTYLEGDTVEFSKDNAVVLPADLFMDFAKTHSENLDFSEQGSNGNGNGGGGKDETKTLDELHMEAADKYMVDHKDEKPVYSFAMSEVLRTDEKLAAAFKAEKFGDGGDE